RRGPVHLVAGAGGVAGSRERARACFSAAANGASVLGITSTNAATTAVTARAAPAPTHVHCRRGQPPSTRRSRSMNDAVAIASVRPTWIAISSQPDTPVRRASKYSMIGQCHRYTPYEMSPSAHNGVHENARPTGPAPLGDVAAAITTAVSRLTATMPPR